jgi:hypothetical protein
MGATSFSGPSFVYGNMGALGAGFGSAVPDPNPDAGPSMSFQGDFLPDVRYPFMKDSVQGRTGIVPGHINFPYFISVDAIPAALGVATIAAAANAVSGTPFTLVSAQAAGITPGVPIRPMTSPVALQSGALTTVLALDFGFAFGNCTSGNKQIVVADSTQFLVGEPLVIAGAGGSATTPLLTNVLSIDDATHISVGPNIPASTNATAPIGTGNNWGPTPAGFPLPDAAFPYIGAGPGLLKDQRQTIARAVSITGSASSTGGNVAVVGFDIYGQPMAETIAAPAGATTVNGKKAFKYILSVTPAFSDAHNYSVGTTDIYGINVRNDRWEYDNIFWNGAFAVVSTGWLAADVTSPATRTTGDVRGTYAVQTTASNGTISGLAMSGRRLAIFSTVPGYNLINSFPASPQFFYGQTQAQ